MGTFPYHLSLAEQVALTLTPVFTGFFSCLGSGRCRCASVRNEGDSQHIFCAYDVWF